MFMRPMRTTEKTELGKMAWATLKAGMTERRNGGMVESRNGGKWPEILKDGITENTPKS